MKVKAGSFLFIPLTPSNPRVNSKYMLLIKNSEIVQYNVVQLFIYNLKT